MEKDFLVLGLMSGTSLDGLDMAACRFSYHNGQWTYSIEAADAVSYNEQLQLQLKNSVNLTGLELSLLDIELGKFFGTSVKEFCESQNLSPQLVGSHGHTVFHQPEKQLTLQIGNPEAISYYSGLPVVANFRIRDVLDGGQGAPLVPFGEHYLFPGYRAFLNLGGIANVAFHEGDMMKGFDTSACNMGLNYLARQLGLGFDKNGDIARSGVMNESLFNALNRLDYFSQQGPKSLGYEWFEQYVAPMLDSTDISTKDALCSFVHHIAYQVNRGLQNLTPDPQKVMATGGGALNTFLIDTLNLYGKERYTYNTPDQKTIEFKEALVFAFLALLRFLGRSNISSQVTGAKSDTSAGSLHGAFHVKTLAD